MPRSSKGSAASSAKGANRSETGAAKSAAAPGQVKKATGAKKATGHAYGKRK